MTIFDMHTAVKLGLDKSSSLPLPAFEPEELDYWLNEAQLQLVKQKAFGNNFRGEGFEDSIKRIDDLTTLVKVENKNVLDLHPFYDNVKYILLSTIPDYMFFVGATAMTASSALETLPVKHEDIRNLIRTEFNDPFIKHPFVYFYDHKLCVIYDFHNEVNALQVKYIKKPNKLVRTVPNIGETNVSELPFQVHPEIVALTVNLLLENIESQRQESNVFQLSKKE